MITKQQKRAEFALEKVQKFMQNSTQLVPEKLATKIVGMPNMILSNGLGQILAFLLSKKSDEEGKIFDVLRDYLQGDLVNIPILQNKNNIDFLRELKKLDFKVYLKAQNEVLLMLEWLKRYGRAFSSK